MTTDRTRRRLDLLGGTVAMVVYASSIVTFVARMAFDVPAGHWIGIPLLLTALPLAYLLATARAERRSPIYIVQIGLMLAFVVLLFILDYVPGIDWRDSQWAVIGFVMVYFGALGGMIGVAAEAGTRWMRTAIGLFFVTAVLAFVQRAVTGI
jgi:hypothetical protein